MRTQIFLVVNRKGVVRMSKRKRPGLFQSERLITLNIVVPDSVFNMPSMVTTLQVPEAHVADPIIVQSVAVTP